MALKNSSQDNQAHFVKNPKHKQVLDAYLSGLSRDKAYTSVFKKLSRSNISYIFNTYKDYINYHKNIANVEVLKAYKSEKIADEYEVMEKCTDIIRGVIMAERIDKIPMEFTDNNGKTYTKLVPQKIKYTDLDKILRAMELLMKIKGVLPKRPEYATQEIKYEVVYDADNLLNGTDKDIANI